MVIKNIDLRIERIEELHITKSQHLKIHELLEHSFPHYPNNQSYYNQIPSFRYLAQSEGEIIGHLGVNYRIIGLNERPVKIFGITDLCIQKSFQSNRIAASMMEKLEELAVRCDIDFLVLIAKQHDFYIENGFQLVQNTGRWLMIRDNRSFGIAQRKLTDCLMVKSMNGMEWERGTADFLGSIF